MTARLKGRRNHVRDIVVAFSGAAAAHSHALAAAVAGSYARGAERYGSDLDLLVIGEPLMRWPAELLRALPFGVRDMATFSYDIVHVQRVRTSRGLWLDLASTTPDWAEARPVNPEAGRIIRHGIASLYDPGQLLERLSTELKAELRPNRWT